MSNDAAGSHGGFDAGSPLTPNSQNRPFDPLLGTSGTSQQLPPDPLNAAGSDPLLGGDQITPVNDLGRSAFIDKLPEALRPEAPVYGDEFESGFLPIDIAARVMGQGMDKAEDALSEASGVAKNWLSKVVQKGVEAVQSSWESPDNDVRQKLDNAGQEATERFGNWFRRVTTGVEYVTPIEDEPATGLGSGAVADGSIEIRQPDFTSAAYTTNNLYARSGLAPASVSSNSRLGASKGNCTWFANGRAEELGGDPQLLDKMTSHAYAWDNQAIAAGITISDRPQPGRVAIAQWESGHVAVVERDNGDGTVTISESSYDAPGGRYDYLYDTRTVAISKIDRFILIPKVNAGIDSGDAGSPEASSEPEVDAGGEQAAPSGGSTGEQFSIGDQSFVWTKQTVESGDTLSEISLDTTGSAGNYQLIADHNGIANVNLIRAGQEIYVPDLVTDNSAGQAGGTDSVAGQDVQVGVNDGLTSGEEGEQIIVVEAGDTMGSIALEYTGNTSNYDEIAAYNGINNPNLIFPGQQIRISSSIENAESALDSKQDALTNPESSSSNPNLETQSPNSNTEATYPGDNSESTTEATPNSAPSFVEATTNSAPSFVEASSSTQGTVDYNELGREELFKGNSTLLNNMQELDKLAKGDYSSHTFLNDLQGSGFLDSDFTEVPENPGQFGGARKKITYREYINLKLKVNAQNAVFNGNNGIINQTIPNYVSEVVKQNTLSCDVAPNEISGEVNKFVKRYEERQASVSSSINMTSYSIEETFRSLPGFFVQSALSGLDLGIAFTPLKEIKNVTNSFLSMNQLIHLGLDTGAPVLNLLGKLEEPLNDMNEAVNVGDNGKALNASLTIAKELIGFAESNPEFKRIGSAIKTYDAARKVLEINDVLTHSATSNMFKEADMLYFNVVQVSCVGEMLAAFMELLSTQVKADVKEIETFAQRLSAIAETSNKAITFSYKESIGRQYDWLRKVDEMNQKQIVDLDETIDKITSKVGNYTASKNFNQLLQSETEYYLS